MKFNLWQIIAAVAVIAATMGVLQNPTDIVTSLVNAICGFMTFLAAGLAVSGKHKLRFFWRGFAVVALLYSGMIWGTFGDYAPKRQLTTQGIDFLFSLLHSEIAIEGRFPSDVGGFEGGIRLGRANATTPFLIPGNFYSIAHSIIGMLLAWLIGDICQVVATSPAGKKKECNIQTIDESGIE